MDIREQIELYAFGKLTGEALRAFEARLTADPAFAAAVARESEMLRALRLIPEVDALREQLNIIEKEQFVSLETTEKRSVPMRWYLAAAAAVLLAVAAVWYFRQPAVLTPEQIFAAHFHPPKTLNAGVRRGEAGSDSTAQNDFRKQWVEAVDLYAQGDFKASLQIWNHLTSRPESADFKSDINYPAGLTAMQAGDFKTAISFFENIPPGYFISDKPWNLALCQLRAGRLSEAKKGFEQIAGSDSPYAGEARKILANVERIEPL